MVDEVNVPGRKLRILLLEDRESDAGLVIYELGRLGIPFESKRVMTEPEFTEQLERFAPEIILADHSLPSYDGISALKLAAEKVPGVPFIFVSGTLGEEIAIEALKHGATDYVLKQRPERLVPAVRRALREVSEREQRKHAEILARKNEERYREFVRMTSEGVARYETDVPCPVGWDHSQQAAQILESARVIECNDSFAHQHGYDRAEQMLGFRLLELMGGSYKDKLDQVAKFVRSNYRMTDFESVRQDRAGRVIWTRCSIVGIVEKDHLVRAWVTQEDITDRKHAEDALRASEERYRALFDRSLDCVYVHDLEGRFFDANPAALELFGYRLGEISRIDLRALLSPEQIELAFQMIEELKATGIQRRPKEFRIQRKDGDSVDVEIQASLLIRDGRPFAVQGIARDITARKKAEAEIRRLNRLYAVLSQVNQARLRARTRQELLQEVCAAAVDHGGYKAAWIGWVDNRSGAVLPVGRAGGPEHYFDVIQVFANDSAGSLGPTSIAIREGTPCIINNFLADPRTSQWVQVARSAGVAAAASFPIRFDGEVVGAFTVYGTETNVFQEKETSLLTEVAADVSSGLDGLEQAAKQKRAEDALRESEERHRAVLRQTGQMVYDYDLRTGQLRWDGAIEEVTGYTPEEMQEVSLQAWKERIHPEDRDRALDALATAINAGRRHFVEYRFRRKDGADISVEDYGSFLRDDRGRSCRMLGTISDITERKRIEERIREQATMLDLAHDAIVVHDLDDRIVYWNESATRLYGWSVEEALGRKAGDLLYQDPAKANEVRSEVLQREDWGGELTQMRKDGENLLVEARFTLIRDRRGRPKSMLAIHTDITERRKLELQFLRAQRMESIGTLAGGIAHDLNNVLAPIMMSCQLLDMDPSPEDQKRLVGMIRTSTKRGADLVRQVLTFCRGVEGRRMELAPKHLIKEVHQILSETFPKSIRFETEIANDLWMVAGDPTQIHQVLLNLCVNARDAMPQGGKLILRAENLTIDDHSAAMLATTKRGPYIVISVVDTGLGIPPEIREKIFNPFFTTKEVGKGTGLGLSTSLTIVKAHGGLITVYSEPGNGTVFKVYLPALANALPVQTQTDAAAVPRGNGELVLVVDDEAFVRMITTQTLQAFGYRTVTANDGAEAVALYRERAQDISIVITDMMMPVMDGPATIDSLLAINPEIKIIAASGLGADAQVAKSTAGRVKALLPKPYSSKILLGTLQDVLHPGLAAPPAENLYKTVPDPS